jgi:regulator of CtrA degradation
MTEKRKVRLAEQDVVSNPETLAKLPARLVELVDASIRLQARIIHIDRLLYEGPDKGQPLAALRPIESQLELLRAVFQA